jgi:hypothetical protein
LPWWPRQGDSAERSRAMQEVVGRCATGEEIRTRAELVDANDIHHTIDFSLRPVRAGTETVAIVAEGRDITALVEKP